MLTEHAAFCGICGKPITSSEAKNMHFKIGESIKPVYLVRAFTDDGIDNYTLPVCPYCRGSIQTLLIYLNNRKED